MFEHGNIHYSLRNALKAVGEILKENSRLIQSQLVDVESERLVLCAFQKLTGRKLSRFDLYSQGNVLSLGSASWNDLLNMAQRRKFGFPLQYILKVETFLHHDYEVGPGVLIPRPETECLVMSVLEKVKSPVLGLEIGLGSGIISIELLLHFQHLKMVASELSEGARKFADSNRNRILGENAKDRLRIIQASTAREVLGAFDSVSDSVIGKADFIVSNPPYLSALPSRGEVEEQVSLYEPHEALFAPSGDPCYFYRNIAENAIHYLKPGGWVFLEIPHERSEEIQGIFQSLKWNIRIEKDLNQRDRVLVAQARSDCQQEK